MKAIPQLSQGMVIAIAIAFTALVLSVTLGSLLNFLVHIAGRPLSAIVAVYVSIIRGTPMLVQLYIVFYLLPEVGIRLKAEYAGLLGFVLNSTAILYEVIRGGITSVGVGQHEAAMAHGMSRLQLWLHIIIPQTLIRILPQITNELIILLKATPLLAFITITEVFRRAQLIFSINFHPVEVLLAATVLFFIVNYLLSIAGRKIEAGLKDRGGAI